MSTFTGNVVTGTSSSGSTRSWRLLLEFSSSETSTTKTVKFVVKLALYGHAAGTTAGFPAGVKYALNVGGSLVKQSATSSELTVNGTDANAVTLCSYSHTYNRGTSDVWKNVKAQIVVPSGAWSGTSTYGNIEKFIKIPALPQYTITAKAQSGTIASTSGWSGTGASATKSVYHGKAIGTLPTVSRTGYQLNRWATAASGGSEIKTSSTFTAKDTIYAQWNPKVYIITLNNQSANAAGTAAYYEKYNTGNYTTSNCTTAITKITNPTKTGYTFKGYYTGTNGSGTSYINSAGTITSTNTTFTANTTLYAYWTINSYTLTYNANGGNTISPAYNTLNYNANYIFPSTPTRTGYTFADWYTAASGGTQVTTSNKMGAANTIIYAHWTPNTYTITFNPNGGIYNNTTSNTTKNVIYDSNTNSSVGIPTRAGYIFQGWYTAISDGTQVFNNRGNAIINTIYWNENSQWIYTNNLTVYALWTAIEPWEDGDYQYTVIDTGEVQAQTYVKNKSSYAPVPTSITHNSIEYNVTSLDNCFKDCTILSGTILVSGTPTSYTDIFTNTYNSIYILSTSSDIDHSVWQNIANDVNYSNVHYLSLDNDYVYIVFGDLVDASVSAKVQRTNQTSYSDLPATLDNGWNVVSLNQCFKNCSSLRTAPTIPRYVQYMNECFLGCDNLQGNIAVFTDLGVSVSDPPVYTDLAGHADNIFSSSTLPIYIVNGAIGSRSVQSIEATWELIAEEYTNVHYEINDIDLSHATFTIDRKYYSDTTVDNYTLSKNNSSYVGSYLVTNFNLPFDDNLKMPVGWIINADTIDAAGHNANRQINGGNDYPLNVIKTNEGFVINPETSNRQKWSGSGTVTLIINFSVIDEDGYPRDSTSIQDQQYTYTLNTSSTINVDFADNNYIYTIINSPIGGPAEVAAYTYDKSKLIYGDWVDNETYKVTSLYYPTLLSDDYIGGCYEGCTNLTTAPYISENITNLNSAFKGCSSLSGNIEVNALGPDTNIDEFNNVQPTLVTDLFTGTILDIFIVNKGIGTNSDVQKVKARWKKIAANSNYSNVHYEGVDNGAPTISKLNVKRGSYTPSQANSNITAPASESEYPRLVDDTGVWIEDDAGSWIQVQVDTSLLATSLPKEWVNNAVRDFTVVFRQDLPPSVVYIDEACIRYIKLNSKVLDINNVEYYTQTGTGTQQDPYVYTRELNPQQSNIDNYFAKSYLTSSLVFYFRDTETSQGNVIVGVGDFYNHYGSLTDIVYQVFAMIDFVPGGRGMAIGKVGERNGLDISLPTTIGEGLLSPLSSEVYILSKDTEVDDEKIYYIRSESGSSYSYTAVVNPEGNPKANGWYERDVDLGNSQLVVGKYNIRDNDAVLIIGNGTNINGNITRSNALIVGADGNIKIAGGLYNMQSEPLICGTKIVRWSGTIGD